MVTTPTLEAHGSNFVCYEAAVTSMIGEASVVTTIGVRAATIS